MPLPDEGQMSWADELNQYLVGAAIEVQADLQTSVAEARAARDEAVVVVDGAVADATAAVQAVLDVLGGSAGLTLDTDGTPYFDPGATPGPGMPVLALLSDTDGVPYYAGA